MPQFVFVAEVIREVDWWRKRRRVLFRACSWDNRAEHVFSVVSNEVPLIDYKLRTETDNNIRNSYN